MIIEDRERVVNGDNKEHKVRFELIIGEEDIFKVKNLLNPWINRVSLLGPFYDFDSINSDTLLKKRQKIRESNFIQIIDYLNSKNKFFLPKIIYKKLKLYAGFNRMSFVLFNSCLIHLSLLGKISSRIRVKKYGDMADNLEFGRIGLENEEVSNNDNIIHKCTSRVTSEDFTEVWCQNNKLRKNLTTGRWNNVTCKDCLKYKNNYEKMLRSKKNKKDHKKKMDIRGGLK